jgi:hypothetical protein
MRWLMSSDGSLATTHILSGGALLLTTVGPGQQIA